MNQQTRRELEGFRRRRVQRIAITLVPIFAWAIGISRAADQTSKLSDEKQAKIEGAISAFMVSSKVPGLSVAVVQDGEFVWSAGFGMADLENSVPATSQTLYRLGSISKPLTATAAMALWSDGSWIWIHPCRSTARHFRRSHGLSLLASS